MKRVVLRWLFKSSPHSLDVVESESEAKEHLRQWREFDPSTRMSPTVNGYDFEQDRHWQIDLREVAAALSLSIEKMQEDYKKQQAALQQQGGGSPSEGGPFSKKWVMS